MQGIGNEIVKAGTSVARVPPPATKTPAGSPAKGLMAGRPRSYEDLLERVRGTLAAGRARAHKVLEAIQSRMFWETGRWIHLYLKKKMGHGGAGLTVRS
ncbi:MAG: hypothetical protein A3G87_08185 [Omnitrophica bacterium RIFCSPLOWO2_12_FULL_50_11]|nr:MAG: hypothetical protein A3G87_08185 [Omnitrophica bacterium RIFCSPLOWO2_12_FULL_50_11]